jgi:hypothetical protein
VGHNNQAIHHHQVWLGFGLNMRKNVLTHLELKMSSKRSNFLGMCCGRETFLNQNVCFVGEPNFARRTPREGVKLFHFHWISDFRKHFVVRGQNEA